MTKRGVWELIDKQYIPNKQSLIGNKWVFKKKKNSIHRARLVALGYSQIPGVKFSENYAPVVNDYNYETYDDVNDNKKLGRRNN